MLDMKNIELEKEYKSLLNEFTILKNKNLSLDLTRGKPSAEQLKLSLNMLEIINSNSSLETLEGIDLLNYGSIDGIKEAKDLFSQILDVKPEELIIGGNSSLNIMHDLITKALLLGVIDSNEPWKDRQKVKFLCPSPGYDRHFAICEAYNIEMINIEMLNDGPDMDKVEELVANDESIKGIWCVPTYSNPEGKVYSEVVVERLAKMKTKANDFKIFWDDAYAVHHLTEKVYKVKNILRACEENGNPNRVFIFASTSKITLPGSGIAAVASSVDNIKFMRKQLSVQTIGPDKINQLRHIRFLKDLDNLNIHMKKHAKILKPKFDKAIKILESELDRYKIATWNNPVGGYFISLDTVDGCAKEIVNLAGELGITLTKAGAAFPYGIDPNDRNIRIAPSFLSLTDVEIAIKSLCLCIKIVVFKKTLKQL